MQINWWRILTGFFLAIAPTACWTKSCFAPMDNVKIETLLPCLFEALIMALCYTAWLYFCYNNKKFPFSPCQRDLDRWASSFLFRSKAIFWLTTASCVSLLTAGVQVVSSHLSWLDVPVYSVVMPSFWLIAGQLLKPVLAGKADESHV